MKRRMLMIATIAGFVLAGCGSQYLTTPQYPPAPQKPRATGPADRIVVYYMHRTLRCISCLTIERETRRALNESYSSQLASGQVEYRSEDYWVNTDLAKRYGVDTVSVVVVAVADGREVSREKLERVWELKGRPNELRSYIAQAVGRSLAKLGR